MPYYQVGNSEINSMPDKYKIERTLIMNMEQALEHAKLVRELKMQDDIKKMSSGSKRTSYQKAPFEPEEGSFGEAILKLITFGVLIFVGFMLYTMISGS